ncbi:MAG: phosphatidylglycerol lysyltransferase domain-containing protein [Bacteroides sp.]|nr:phosphatidylglycerol lysyltransferase domain-containing protein [Prevotella sp.]MCM1407673.1 phosphatidylglycerol lysyltransferase domain-containing protein [Treponema brennaborense]MCM1469177.1 phosphatidylglycerol lysyltransferase domain-containing protein [Bacteroides sp.]
MQSIPFFPEFAPISADMKNELHPFFTKLTDGISEFTFSGLLIHQKQFQYEIARIPLPANENPFYIIRGKNPCPFFYVPEIVPADNIIQSVFGALPEAYWDAVSQKQADMLDPTVFSVEFLRGSSDYVYTRQQLAELSGRAFHKKRNKIHAFNSLYSSEVKKLDTGSSGQLIADAHFVLDSWHEAHKAAHPDTSDDYQPCGEAINLVKSGMQSGICVYADGKPAGISIGELSADGSCFFTHFEKCVPGYNGIYQFINCAAASALPETVRYINREQDLDDPGLRQAKETYRPDRFIKKYKVQMI